MKPLVNSGVESFDGGTWYCFSRLKIFCFKESSLALSWFSSLVNWVDWFFSSINLAVMSKISIFIDSIWHFTGMCYHVCMLVIYTIRQFSQSLKAKLQKRDRKGRFAKPLPKPSDVEKNPLVTFYYPMSDQPWNSKLRQVRLISATSTHITGLEMTKVGNRTRYQFKKFCQPKVSEFKVQAFNPTSMS